MENKGKFPVNPEGMFGAEGFLPITPEELNGEPPDFVMVTPEAYVDHPSFGHALIARLFESYGFTVAVLYNPKTEREYRRFGCPNYGFLITGGAVDSMVNNYTVAKRRREKDVYSPGGKPERPDRAVEFYSKNIRAFYPDTVIIIGGIEASLRRLCHYDYWADKVLPSILDTCEADLLIYGMGEKPVADIVERIRKGIPLKRIKDVRGTAYLSDYDNLPAVIRRRVEEKDFSDTEILPSYGEVYSDKKSYASSYRRAERNTDFYSGKLLLQKQKSGKYVVVNKPQFPLTEKEMDAVYALPYKREVHPYFASLGKVASVDEVKFSISTHRGCYGGCSFCALTFHQGRIIQTRSCDSIIREAVELTKMPDFKGYIHDVGGPTANFHRPACDKQLTKGVCPDRNCIGYKPCPNLKVDHSEYLDVLRKLRAIKGVKKVFIRSGVRFDYLMYDEDKTFFRELITYHVSGQLKVAPEHIDDRVLYYMNKPPHSVYEAFVSEYRKLNADEGKDQYLVPYLISSHPGCSLDSAVNLAVYLKSLNYMPEQVQDFYPTPSTRATTMYWSGYDPEDMKPVYTAKTESEKAMQRALLQYRLPQSRQRVIEALTLTHREELIPRLVGVNVATNANKQGSNKQQSASTQRQTSANRQTSGNRQQGASSQRYSDGKTQRQPSANARGKSEKGSSFNKCAGSFNQNAGSFNQNGSSQGKGGNSFGKNANPKNTAHSPEKTKTVKTSQKAEGNAKELRKNNKGKH